MSGAQDGAARALEHVRALAGEIGPRGSCTAAEERAAAYAADRMRSLGLQGVAVEPFRGSPSTYRPYALAFATALLAALLALLLPGEGLALAAAAVLSGLGAWGMLRETDLAGNWLRRLLPAGRSRNAVGIVPPSGEVRRRAVLCAHLDTHRTPIFYSSPAWQRLFSLLVGAAFASLAAGALLYALGAALGWSWVRWPGLAAAAVQLVALALCLHADRTPFSPGANDNASGVGVALALAARLDLPRGLPDAEQPLAGRMVALIFEKPSTRTRVSFDVGVRQMGGQSLVLSGAEMQLGHGETIADTARVLSRYVDLIMIRTFEEQTLLEMAEHATLAANLQLKVFFCHAHSPWERATCESQNDRIRHYLPKGTDLSLVSYQQLRAYQDMLNERPRKILNWKSPAQCFQELLISNQPSN